MSISFFKFLLYIIWSFVIISWGIDPLLLWNVPCLSLVLKTGQIPFPGLLCLTLIYVFQLYSVCIFFHHFTLNLFVSSCWWWLFWGTAHAFFYLEQLCLRFNRSDHLQLIIDGVNICFLFDPPTFKKDFSLFLAPFGLVCSIPF